MRQRLDDIRARISRACERANRGSDEVRLLAVSKKQPIELVEEAYRLGVRDFGENYVQELSEKRHRLASLGDIRWHLIGHLQSNKAKQAIASADVFHSLGSVRLALELGRRALDAGLEPWPVFIEVNVDAQDTKSGVTPEALRPLIETVRAQKALKLEGLMCIPEPRPESEAVRSSFKRLAELAKLHGLRDAKLSMGMSRDFEIAVEEGANWVRIGTSLFGERKSQ